MRLPPTFICPQLTETFNTGRKKATNVQISVGILMKEYRVVLLTMAPAQLTVILIVGKH